MQTDLQWQKVYPWLLGNGKAGEGGREGSQSVRRKLLWVVDMFTRLIVSMVS